MADLLKKYFNIAFLMGKPQDLPAGENQLYLAILLNFVTYVLALAKFDGVGKASLHAIIDIGFVGGFFYLALVVTNKKPRFQQAFGAICGAGAVLNLSAVPMLGLTFKQSGESISQFGEFAWFVLLAWSLSLFAHVVRHTFGIRMINSILIAVAYYIFIIQLLAAVLPASDVATEAYSGENEVMINEIK